MKVRFGTFETNSSSAHTFVLRSNSEHVTDEEIKNYIDDADVKYGNYLCIHRSFSGDMDFGRGFEILAEWHEKMSYLIAAFKNSENSKVVIDVIKKRLGVDGIILHKYEYGYDEDDVDENFPLYCEQWEEKESFGSIDHQSYDCYEHAITAIRKDPTYTDMTLEEIIFEIIFCNKFVIVCDSDESWTFEKLSAQSFFKDAGFTHVLNENYEMDDNGEYHYNPIFENFDEYMEKRENDE